MEKHEEKIEVHIHNGVQINIAKENGRIEANQKNIISDEVLKTAIGQTVVSGNIFE